MSEPLRPLDLGEILDRTVQIYRSRFLVFFGIETIPTGTLLVIVGGIALFFAWASKSDSGSGSNSPAAVLLAGVFLVLLAMVTLCALAVASVLGTAAMNHATAAAHSGGIISIRGAYKAAWPRGWRYVGLYLLQGFITWGIPVAASFALFMLLPVSIAFAGAGSGASIFFGFLFFLLFVAVAIYLVMAVIRLCLAFPACIIEQRGVWDSIKRGNSLSEGTRGRLFLLYLLVWVLDRILSMAIIVPTIIVLAVLPGMKNPDQQETLGTVFMLVVYGSAFAVQAFTKPVTGIALMLFYYDQRIRKEGYDIEWLMLRAGLLAPVAPPQQTIPWVAAATSAPQPQLAVANAAALIVEEEPATETEPATAQPTQEQLLREEPL